MWPVSPAASEVHIASLDSGNHARQVKVGFSGHTGSDGSFVDHRAKTVPLFRLKAESKRELDLTLCAEAYRRFNCLQHRSERTAGGASVCYVRDSGGLAASGEAEASPPWKLFFKRPPV